MWHTLGTLMRDGGTTSAMRESRRAKQRFLSFRVAEKSPRIPSLQSRTLGANPVLIGRQLSKPPRRDLLWNLEDLTVYKIDYKAVDEKPEVRFM